MRHSLSKTFSFLAFSLSLASCSGHGNYMAFTDNVVYVKAFPEEYSLTGAEEVDAGVLGVLSLKIMDSLLVVGTSGDPAWKIFSLDDLSEVTSLIRKGNGPGEFLSVPWLSQVEFYEEDGKTFCYLLEFSKSEMYRMDFSESLKMGQAEIETIGTGLPYLSFGLVYVGDSTYYCRVFADNSTRIERVFVRGGEASVPSWLEEINSAHVDPGVDFNLLSAGLSYKRDRNLIIETPVYLDNINLYTLDGSFRKSVNIGRRLSDIDDMQELSIHDRTDTFSGACLYDDFFAVLYCRETSMENYYGKYGEPHIFCFDYEGNPLADIRLDEHCTGFDFDFDGAILYAVDYERDKLLRYALPEGFDLEKLR